MSEQINLQYTVVRHPLPDFIYDGIRPYCTNANVYHSQPSDLIEKLAEKYHVKRQHIFLTAGIDEAIQLFAMAYGKESVVFVPTYTIYEEIPQFGNNAVTFEYSLHNFNYRVRAKEYPEATLICLVNPNNPCGTIPLETIIEMIELNPQAIITVDEAYGEFVGESMIPFVEKYDNLAVFRSFSKAYGMAGNRIGYVFAREAVIERIKTKTQWCNLSYLSVGAAMSALKHEEFFVRLREELVAERLLLEESIDKANLRTLTSLINSCLIVFEQESKAFEFVSYLKEYGITISHGNGNSNCGLDYRFVRIAIGRPHEMVIAREIIESFVAEE